MRLLVVHLGRVLRDVGRESLQTRNPWVAIVAVLGMAIAAAGLAVSTAGPVAIYPFA